MCVIYPCLTTHVVSTSEIIDNSEEANGITKCFDLYSKGRKYNGVEVKQAWADADADVNIAMGRHPSAGGGGAAAAGADVRTAAHHVVPPME